LVDVKCWPLSWVDHQNIFYSKKKLNWTIINTLTMCWCHATSCHHLYSMFWICDDMVVTQIKHLNYFCGPCLQVDENWTICSKLDEWKLWYWWQYVGHKFKIWTKIETSCDHVNLHGQKLVAISIGVIHLK
jgi:hypothetical protein